MNYKLGKLPAKIDKRTLQLSKIVKALPPIPNTYDFYETSQVNIIPRMFMNDELGCCVVSGTAHQILRFELVEERTTKLVEISDDDIRNQYFYESHGQDSGLVMLDHMKEWRSTGFRTNGRKLLCLRWGGMQYKIDAFAQVHPSDAQEVKAAVYLLNGVNVGLSLPNNFREDFAAGRPWDDTSQAPNPYNGHCVYVQDFPDPDHLRCVTWGKYQLMGWNFFSKYCDEAFAIVDEMDEWLEKSYIDVPKLREYLAEVSA
jgi:hypothetical protein